MRRRLWLWFGLIALLLVAVVGAPRLIPKGRSTETAATGGLWRPWLPFVRGEMTPRDVTGPAEPPVPIVEVDGTAVTTVRGTYCWRHGDTSLCADAVDPAKLVARMVAPLVAPGATVTVRFPLAPNPGSVGVNWWADHGAQAISVAKDGSFQVPITPGLYVYEVHARWAPGDASYAFLLSVPGSLQDDKPVGDDPHSLSQPPEITVRVAGVALPVVRGAYCWSHGVNAVCTDTLSPAEQLAKLPSPVVSAGALAEIRIGPGPQIEGFQVWRVVGGARELVERDPNGFVPLPAAIGRYFYQVDGRWAEGSGSYGFQVEVRS
jgi:hypothetical protein